MHQTLPNNFKVWIYCFGEQRLIQYCSRVQHKKKANGYTFSTPQTSLRKGSKTFWCSIDLLYPNKRKHKQACLSHSSENKNALWHVLNMECHNEFSIIVEPIKKRNIAEDKSTYFFFFFGPTETNCDLSNLKEQNVEEST